MKLTHRQKTILSDHLWALVLIAPLLIGLIVFYVIPFFQNIYNSFTSLGSFGISNWVGLDNYRTLFQDKEVWNAFRNTIVYTVVSVPLIIVLSMSIAQLLNNNIKGKTFYRVLYFLPSVTMPAAIGMIWKWIYNGQFGILNQILGIFNIDPIYWTSDPDYAMAALIIVGVWSGLGMNIIYFLAGLQTIPRTYYEAAEIDGASPFTKFIKITVPLLTPTIFFVTITQFISSFQMFDLVYMLISRSSLALDSTKSIVYVFYQNAFELMNKGYASAISMIIFVVILIITAIQLKLQKRWVFYQ